MSEVLLAVHHSMLAHGLAVQAIRERAKQSPVIGFAPVAVFFIPPRVRSGPRRPPCRG